MKQRDCDYIIDANVALVAGTPVKDIPQEQLQCAKKCVEYIRELMGNSKPNLVLDLEGRILKEYRNAFSMKECPNVATEFYKWAMQSMAYPQNTISLKEISENVFKDYPNSPKLKEFDPSDRKYIALAYKHPKKPPIVEASDSKWWGIRDEMKKNGMEVLFLDEDYIKTKYEQKIGL